MFSCYSPVVTSGIALLHLKDAFLVDSTKNKGDGHKAFRNKHTKSGAVWEAQQPEGNFFSLLSVPTQLCVSFDKETAFQQPGTFHTLPPLDTPGGSRERRQRLKETRLLWCAVLLGGAAERGQRSGVLPSFLPPLFFLKFIVKGQRSRVHHVTLTGPAY